MEMDNEEIDDNKTKYKKIIHTYRASSRSSRHRRDDGDSFTEHWDDGKIIHYRTAFERPERKRWKSKYIKVNIIYRYPAERRTGQPREYRREASRKDERSRRERTRAIGVSCPSLADDDSRRRRMLLSSVERVDNRHLLVIDVVCI